MKKWLLRFFLFACVVFASLTLAWNFLQEWAVSQVLRHYFAEATVARVSVGPFLLSTRDLHVKNANVDLTIASLDIQWDAWKTLTKKSLHVKSIEGNAHITLPDNSTIALDLHGGDLFPGSQATITLNATLKPQKILVRQCFMQSQVSLNEDLYGHFSRLQLKSDIKIDTPTAQYPLLLEVVSIPGKKNNQDSLRLSSPDHLLVSLDGTHTLQEGAYTVKFDVDEPSINALLATFSLPNVALHGNGTLHGNWSKNTGHSNLTFSSKLTELNRLKPQLVALQSIDVNTTAKFDWKAHELNIKGQTQTDFQFDAKSQLPLFSNTTTYQTIFNSSDQTLMISQLTNTLRISDQIVATIETLEPILLNSRKNANSLDTTNSQQNILKIAINRFPLNIFGSLTAPVSIRNGWLSTTCFVKSHKRKDLALNGHIHVENLDVLKGNTLLLENLNISGLTYLTWNPKMASFVLDDVCFMDGKSAELLRASLKTEIDCQTNTLGATQFDATLFIIPWYNQPPLRKAPLMSGSLTFWGSMDANKLFSVNGTVNVSDGSPKTLLSLKASPTISGKFFNQSVSLQLKSPLILQSENGTSDLLGTAKLNVSAARPEGIINISSNALIVDDFITLANKIQAIKDALSSIQPNPPTVSSPPPPQTPSSQKETVKTITTNHPFWSPFIGSLDTDIKRLTYQRQTLAEGLHCAVQLHPKVLDMQTESKYLLGGELDFNTHLTFNEDPQATYKLQSYCSLKHLNAQKLLSAFAPKYEKMLSGDFDVVGNLKSQATLENLMNNAQGSCLLESLQGQIHPFAIQSSFAQILPFATSLLGQFTDTIKPIDYLSHYVENLTYAPLTIRISRPKSLDILVESAILQTPEISLSVSGLIKNVPNTPILKQPLMLKCGISSKGGSLEAFKSLGLTFSTSASSNGYFAGPNPAIKGTLENPDYTEIKNLLFHSKPAQDSASKAVQGIQSLLKNILQP